MTDLQFSTNSYQARNWSATMRTVGISGQASQTLTVVGQVKTTANNEVPELSRKEPQGATSSQLILELNVLSTRVGDRDVGWRDVSYSAPVTDESYESVLITGVCTETVKITDDEHGCR